MTPLLTHCIIASFVILFIIGSYGDKIREWEEGDCIEEDEE